MNFKKLIIESLEAFTTSGADHNTDDINHDLTALIGLEGIFIQHFFNHILPNEIVGSMLENANIDESSSTTTNTETHSISIPVKNNNEENETTTELNVSLLQQGPSSSATTRQRQQLQQLQKIVSSDFIDSIAQTLFEVIVLRTDQQQQHKEGEQQHDVDTRELMSSVVTLFDFSSPTAFAEEEHNDDDVDDADDNDNNDNNQLQTTSFKRWNRDLVLLQFFEKVIRYRAQVQKGRIFAWFDDLNDLMLRRCLISLERDRDNQHEEADQSTTRLLLTISSVQESFISSCSKIMNLFVENILLHQSSPQISSEKVARWKKSMTQSILHLIWLDSTFDIKEEEKEEDKNELDDAASSSSSLLFESFNKLVPDRDSFLLLALEFGLMTKIAETSIKTTAKSASDRFFSLGKKDGFRISKLLLESNDRFVYELARNEKEFGGILFSSSQNDENNDDQPVRHQHAEAILNNTKRCEEKQKQLKNDFDFVSDDEEDEKEREEFRRKQQKEEAEQNDASSSLLKFSHDHEDGDAKGDKNSIRRKFNEAFGEEASHVILSKGGFPLSSPGAACGWMIVALKFYLLPSTKENNNDEEKQRKQSDEALALLCLQVFSYASHNINFWLKVFYTTTSSTFNKKTKNLLHFLCLFVEKTLTNIPLYSIKCEKKEEFESALFTTTTTTDDDEQQHGEQKLSLRDRFTEKILTQKSLLGETISITLQTLAWLSSEITDRGRPMMMNQEEGKVTDANNNNEENEENFPQLLIQPMNTLLQKCDEHSRFKILASLLILSPSDGVTTTFLAAWRFCMADDLSLCENEVMKMKMKNHSDDSTDQQQVPQQDQQLPLFIRRRDLRSPFLNGPLVFLVLSSAVHHWIVTGSWMLFQFRKESSLMVLQLISWFRSIEMRIKRMVGVSEGGNANNNIGLFLDHSNENDQKVLKIAKKDIVEKIKQKFEAEKKRIERMTEAAKTKRSSDEGGVMLAGKNTMGGEDALVMFQFENFLNAVEMTLDNFAK